MSNIIIKKTDSDLDYDVIYFKVEIRNQDNLKPGKSGLFGGLFMYGCIERINFKEIANDIIAYSSNPTESYCFQMADNLVDIDSILILELLPASHRGYVEIKVSMEIRINAEKHEKHVFYIKSEIGLIEQFGKRLESFSEQYGLQEISLRDQE